MPDLKLTIDVNLMVNESVCAAAMDTLKRWRDEGKIDLVEADPPKQPKPSAYNWPGAPPRAPEPSGPGGRRPRKMQESGRANFKAVAAVLFPGKDPLKLSMTDINQVAHLIRHHLSKNEIFVTGNTKDFIDGHRREILKSQFGIVVMTPEEVVSSLGSREGWQPPPKVSKAAASAKKSKKA